MRRRLIDDDAGVTSIEYVLIASLIAVVIVVATQAVGARTLGLFTRVGNAFS